jgi:hypothetical protein
MKMNASWADGKDYRCSIKILTAVVMKCYISRDFGKPIALFATLFRLLCCLAYSSTLKMEATCSFETSVDFKHTTLTL